MRRPPAAVLLDRDGTLNVKAPEGDYVRRPGDLVLLPGAAAAVRRLNEAGVPAVVVTNQRGVARGLMSLDDVGAVHDRLAALLAAEGAHLQGVYVCPHAAGTCDCRKPAPGLVHQFLHDRPELDPTALVVVGDAASDVGLARAVGAGAVRLADRPDPAADLTVATVEDAVTALLA